MDFTNQISQELVRSVKTELFDLNYNNEVTSLHLKNKNPFLDEIVPKIKVEALDSDYQDHSESKIQCEHKALTQDLLATVKQEEFDLDADLEDQVPFVANLVAVVKTELHVKKKKSSASKNKSNCNELENARILRPKKMNSKLQNVDEPTANMLLKTEGNSVLKLVPVVEKLDASGYKGNIEEIPDCKTSGEVSRKRKRLKKHKIHKVSNEELLTDDGSDKKKLCRQKLEIKVLEDSDLKEDKKALNALRSDYESFEEFTDIDAKKTAFSSKQRIKKLDKYIKTTGYDMNYILKNSIKKKVNRKLYRTCKICDFTSNHYYNFRIHMLGHSGRKPYTCKICNKCFTTKVKVRTHLEVHSERRKYKCKKCDYRCRDKGNMKVHQRSHTGEKPYKCKYCNYRCTQISHLKRHVRMHTNEKQYKCQFCDYRCIDKHCLVSHVRIHTKEKPYKCKYCDYSSTQSHCITTHTKVHTSTGEKPYKCNDCSFSTHYRGSIILHTKTHLQIKQTLKKHE